MQQKAALFIEAQSQAINAQAEQMVQAKEAQLQTLERRALTDDQDKSQKEYTLTQMNQETLCLKDQLQKTEATYAQELSNQQQERILIDELREQHLLMEAELQHQHQRHIMVEQKEQAIMAQLFLRDHRLLSDRSLSCWSTPCWWCHQSCEWMKMGTILVVVFCPQL